MNNIRKKIYLGALLHDIGKFYQRADARLSDIENELSLFSKKIAEDICPINDYGRFGYQHVIWTNQFFELFNDKIKQLPGVKENLYYDSSVDNIITFACNHHRPQTLLQSFITIGDWWSAGVDRQNIDNIKFENYTQETIDWGKNRYKTIPLFSVFNSINTNSDDKSNDLYFSSSAFLLNPLSLEREDIFTKKIQSKEDGISEKDYKRLWNEFIDEFNELPTDSIDGFTESLLYLLKKYTWCIPSNTNDMANVSLFEHLKTTAAFADSIYAFYSDNNEHKFIFNKINNRLKVNNDVHPVMLVGGDISGIQKFIYNIASQKAAVSLKGRSFYLQLLIDSIIQKIVDHKDIQVTPGHVVYSSGGKFYMILPNIEKVKNALTSIKEEIEQELWEEHKGKLSVNIASISFSVINSSNSNISIEGETENKNIGDLWRILAEKLNGKKNIKFKSILNIDFFNKQKVEEDIKMCAVTGEELKKDDRVKLEKIDAYVSKAVYQQTQLGVSLKDVDYLITSRSNEKHKYLSSRSAKKGNSKIVGVYNYLFDKDDLYKKNEDFMKITSVDISQVMKINNTKFLKPKLNGNAVSYGFKFYGGNKQAEYLGKNKTFEELTKIDNNKTTYLGVLRMDVDGLGNIFIKGLPDKEKSFGAYATMSFQLDLFFSGYLNTIRNKNEYKDFVNILYSGGDDIFAVGRWDLLLKFAEEIRKEFAEFIGRDDISISAGLAIIRNKFPIAKAAQIAGKAEELSKEFFGDKKNAITFLGETISWKDEFEEVKSVKDEFKRLISSGMPTTILHKIMHFASLKKANDTFIKDNKKDKIDFSYKWNAAYYLKRFNDRHGKNNNEINKFIISLQNKFIISLQNKFIIDNNNRNYELMALAARWAELEYRESNSK